MKPVPVAHRLRHGLLALLLIAGLANAATLEGQQFPDRITLGESELKLNGLGLRAVAIIRAYVVGLYLSEHAGTEQAVVAAPGPKRIEIRMLREASAKEFTRALVRGIRKNAAPEELNRLQERIRQMEDAINMIGTVREGDRITLDLDPARKSRLRRKTSPRRPRCLGPGPGISFRRSRTGA